MTVMPATSPWTVVLRGDATLRGRLEDGVVSDTAWGKLVRRDVFRGVRYTADDSFADAAVVRALCTNARWIACIPDVLFHYRLKDTVIAASYYGPDFVEN